MDKTIYMQDLVEEYVHKNKILKKDFADAVGISPVKLSHWLHGRCGLNKTVLTRIQMEIEKNEKN